MSYFGLTKTISYAHHEVHEGKAYNVSHVFPGASVSPVEVVIDNTLNPKSLHCNFGVDTTEDCQFYIFEEPTIVGSPPTGSPIGNAIDVVQLNRDSANVSGATVYHSPTNVTDPGEQLRHVFIAAASGFLFPGAGSDGAPARGGTELILSAGKSYLLRVTFSPVGTIGIEFSFYEESPLP